MSFLIPIPIPMAAGFDTGERTVCAVPFRFARAPDTVAPVSSPPPPPAHDVGALYAAYGRLVLRRALRFVSPSDAEEIMHEVFIRALEALPPDDGGVSPVHWLYRVTTNLCINRLRDERRQGELLALYGPTAWDQCELGKTPETRTFIRQLWCILDEELATIGTYFYVDGLSTAAIGAILGVTDRTVANRLKAIEVKLKAAIARETI